MQDQWLKEYQVRIYEVDQTGNVPLTTLLNLYQDAATEHADHMGVGLSCLSDAGMSWFITRIHVRMESYPRYGDVLRVRTWPRGRKKVFAYRDFEFSTGEKIIGSGSSIWCLIDLKGKKALNPSRVLPSFPERDERALLTDFPTLPGAGPCHLEVVFSPRWNEIDLNRHVNNTACMNWALETLCSLTRDEYVPVELEVNFKNEAFRDDEVLSRVYIERKQDEITTCHLLSNSLTGDEVLRQRVNWRKYRP